MTTIISYRNKMKTCYTTVLLCAFFTLLFTNYNKSE